MLKKIFHRKIYGRKKPGDSYPENGLSGVRKLPFFHDRLIIV